ncbi:MAG TPA: DUF4388 domain-containing protein [Chroococcales cyanobacterium]
MAKLILSGDLSRFRCDMVVRILEATKFEGEIQFDGPEKGQLYIAQGRVVGAKTATSEGLEALMAILPWSTGIFAVRETQEVLRNQDLSGFTDNMALFRYLQGEFAKQTSPAPSANVPRAAAPPLKAPTTGPLARVPELTEKGRITLRSIQTNYALRGVQVDDDIWKLLAKVDGKLNLQQIGGFCNVLGDRLNETVEELQNQGLVKFKTFDPAAEQLKNAGTKFRFGEYMVAKGIISEIQLQAALNRQAELARKGRYMWLGEILVEMNYARPSQVQEALAVQKRQGG